MDKLTRRSALQQTASVGILATVVASADAKDKPAAAPRTDRDIVIAAGLTPDEADCWEFAAKAAGKFFQLSELHPMDRQEVASAIHVLQNKLLGRPAYRKYLELAKGAGK